MQLYTYTCIYIIFVLSKFPEMTFQYVTYKIMDFYICCETYRSNTGMHWCKSIQISVSRFIEVRENKKKLEWWPIRESREDTGEYCIYVTVYI